MTPLPTDIPSGTTTGHESHHDTLHTAHNKGQFLTVGQSGSLAVGVGVTRFPFPFAVTLLGARMIVPTAPTGASIIVDINKGLAGANTWTTIYTTQANRPTIAAAAHDSGAIVAPNVTAMAQFDYLVFDIDQVGSTIPGSDLVIVVEYQLA